MIPSNEFGLQERLRSNTKRLIDDIETTFEIIIEEHFINHFTTPKELLNENEVSNKKILKLLQEHPDDFVRIIKEKTFVSKIELINKNINLLESNDQQYWNEASADLSMANEVRKDISHNHPITYEHWDYVVQFCQNRIKTKSPIFDLLSNSLKNFEKSAIQSNFDDGDRLFNFPEPDYFLSRFIGRKDLFKAVQKDLLDSSWPVVCIYGPGGYGKSAFVDHICRYFAVSGSYDKIIWFSDKKEYFDVKTSKTLSVTKEKSLELFEKNPTQENLSFEEVAGKGRILTVIDNLETFFDEGKEFVNKYATAKCQFIVTSRIEAGIGNSYRLNTLEPHEGVILINNLNRFLSVDEINESSDVEKKELSITLENSPLVIKWALYQMQKGMQSEALKNRQSSITEFCFSGLIDILSDNAKKCLHLLAISEKKLSLLQMQIILNLDIDEVETCLGELQQNSLMKVKKVNRIKVFGVNHSVRKLLKESDLEELHEKLKMQNNADRMNIVTSKIKEKVANEPQYFYNQKSLEIGDDNDLYIAWKLDEIWFSYVALEKRDREKALQDQIEDIEFLNSIYPNNSQLLCNLGIAHYYADQMSEAINKCKLAYDFAETSFMKKKSLYFLCSALDRTKQFYEAKKYAEKLYSIDSSYESLKTIIGIYIGLGNYEKAFEYFDIFIPKLQSISDHHVGVNSFMNYLKLLNDFLRFGEHDQNTLKKIFFQLSESYKFINFFDKRSLVKLKDVIISFDITYSRFLNRSLSKSVHSIQDLKDILISKLQNEKDRDLMIEYVSSWDLSPGGISAYQKRGKNRQQSEAINLPNENFDEPILEEAWKKKGSFEGKIAFEQLSRQGVVSGYMVQVNKAKCFLPLSEKTPETTVGYTGLFYLTEKTKRNFVCKHHQSKSSAISQETDNYAYRQVKVNDLIDGTITKVRSDSIVVTFKVGSKKLQGYMYLSDYKKRNVSEDLRDNFDINEKHKFEVISSKPHKNQPSKKFIKLIIA